MEPATVLLCKHFLLFFFLHSNIHPAFIFIETSPLFTVTGQVFHINLRFYYDTVNLKTVFCILLLISYVVTLPILTFSFSILQCVCVTAPQKHLQVVKGEAGLTGMTVYKTWTHSFLWVMSEMHPCCLMDRRRSHLSLARHR